MKNSPMFKASFKLGDLQAQVETRGVPIAGLIRRILEISLVFLLCQSPHLNHQMDTYAYPEVCSGMNQ